MFSMSYSPGDIILVPIPFTDLSSRKVRPAIVVVFSPRGNDLFVIPITSQTANIEKPLQDWRQSGLNVPCGIKAQIATIDSGIAIKAVGKLSSGDKNALNLSLRQWLNL
jgi:mRNA interferase MazF